MSDSVEVFVALLDEGTSVWRPVAAEPVKSGRFRLLGPTPEDEVWEFATGDVVRCETRTLSDGIALVAVERISAEPSAAVDAAASDGSG